MGLGAHGLEAERNACSGWQQVPFVERKFAALLPLNNGENVGAVLGQLGLCPAQRHEGGGKIEGGHGVFDYLARWHTRAVPDHGHAQKALIVHGAL